MVRCAGIISTSWFVSLRYLVISSGLSVKYSSIEDVTRNLLSLLRSSITFLKLLRPTPSVLGGFLVTVTSFVAGDSFNTGPTNSFLSTSVTLMVLISRTSSSDTPNCSAILLSTPIPPLIKPTFLYSGLFILS